MIIFCAQVQQILRIGFVSEKLQGQSITIPIARANAMLRESTVAQLKQAITDIGGAINFQIKYQGKACKSYVIPQSFLPSRVYDKLQECR